MIQQCPCLKLHDGHKEWGFLGALLSPARRKEKSLNRMCPSHTSPPPKHAVVTMWHLWLSVIVSNHPWLSVITWWPKSPCHKSPFAKCCTKPEQQQKKKRKKARVTMYPNWEWSDSGYEARNDFWACSRMWEFGSKLEVSVSHMHSIKRFIFHCIRKGIA